MLFSSVYNETFTFVYLAYKKHKTRHHETVISAQNLQLWSKQLNYVIVGIDFVIFELGGIVMIHVLISNAHELASK